MQEIYQHMQIKLFHSTSDKLQQDEESWTLMSTQS